MKNNRVK